MRLLFATIALLFAIHARAACVDGVCVPWMDATDPVRAGFRIVTAHPAGGTLTLRSLTDGKRWTFDATAAQIAELRTLILPSGSYVLSVALERHRRAERTLEVAQRAAVDLGAIRVTRLPRIEGEVRRPDGKPLGGAQVSLHPSAHAVTTTPAGRFVLDVEGHWPSHVVVRHAGLGTRVIALHPTESDVKVPAVTMRRGTTLRLRVARGNERGPIEVKLGANGDESRPVWLATKTLAPNQKSVAFDDLDADVYRVLLSGREPLERVALLAVMKDEATTIDVRLPDTRIVGTLTLGGEPLPGAAVELRRRGLWSSTLITDANGEYASGVWESTDLDATITGPMFPAPRLVRLPAGKGLNIDLPARELRGIVVDDRGKPVPRAQVALEVQTDETRAYIRTVSDSEGRYAFAALDAGDVALHAQADGYLRTDPIPLTIAADQNTAEQTVVLSTTYPRAVTVVDREGRPAAGAGIVCAVNGRIRATAVTDAAGNATIATPAEASALFIIPRESSLAVVRLRPALDDPALVHRIVVPPGEAKLDITALAGDEPIPGVSLLMRFNGELFTPAIARELRLWHRSNLRTGDDGRATLAQIPAGYYEFWPYANDEEAELLIDSAMAAPIALHVTPGENDVKVRFEARR